MKVRELALKYKKRPKDFVRMLNDLGVKVKAENATLDQVTISIISDLMNQEKKAAEAAVTEKSPEVIGLNSDQITLSGFSKLIQRPLKDIMTIVLKKGLLLNLNSQIDATLAIDIAKDLNIDLIPQQAATEASTDIKDKIQEFGQQLNKSELKSRPPVIAIMGHVDHGKTLLLDRIRSSNVADQEAGGITQHIGAYQIRLENKKKMTFLDTPGHEAFTALRSRGAQVTDIAIIVIAADDGIKPQTIEAINHVKAADVPIIIAINKIDAPGAAIEQCKQQLMDHELVPEEWGGSAVIVPISAKTGEGIPQLLEMIELVSDVQELKTNYSGLCRGITIESTLDKQRGPVATILIQSGKLRIGSHVVIGHIYGKIKSMQNDHGTIIDVALPSTPIEVLGFNNVPTPGDVLEMFDTEQAAKKVAETRLLSKRNASLAIKKSVSLDTLSNQISDGNIKVLNLIIKADVNGSLDALKLSVNQINSTDVSINIIHSGTGIINENDVLLAKASRAIIFGFRVTPSANAKKQAEVNGIDLKIYDIIYTIIDDIKAAIDGLYTKKTIETKIGTAEVREVFKFSKIGTIAGSYVTDGVFKRNKLAKIYRHNDHIHSGKVSSLKRFKDDVKEVQLNYECGIVVDGFSTFKSGDVIECYDVHEE